MRNQRGITLIALVITIIVLLILAGVSIAMLTGDNGILSNAQRSSKETAVANAKEKIATQINEAMTEYYANVYVDNGSNTIAKSIDAELTQYASGKKDDGGATITYTKATDVTVDNAEGTITVTYQDLTATGTITYKTGAISWDK